MREDAVDSPQSPRPRALTLAALLGGVSLVFSYLGAFAVTNALVAADLIEKWSPGHDPRPAWMLRGFVGSLVGFALIAGLLRWSGRNAHRAEDTDDAEPQC
jgi:hypothetical protein